MRNALENQNSNPDGLRLLKPKYVESEHKIYVDELNRAIREPGVCNIALSGPYGVGKSSILQGLGRDHPEAIFVSLSTLGFQESKNHRSTKRSSEKGVVSEETNRIQKEIVKQLLYRVAPNKLPASRFKRIHRMTWPFRIGASCISGLIVTIVLVTLGITTKIPPILSAGSPWIDFALKFAVVWLVVAVAALAASPFLEGRVQLDKITAGSTTISLSRGNDTYFDEYLDEIMYFFEVNRKDVAEEIIVIFEDIDRFDNAEIFEELRELNTLLNNAEQLNKKSKRLLGERQAGNFAGGQGSSPIVFIYAMKDSIFDASSSMNSEETGDRPPLPHDKASLEVERANRTKFFDIIIPVVPFVTHQSARDLLRQELEGVEWKVSDELINQASKYVPELRLIRSVCNEYRVYAKRLLGQGSLDLQPDHLFAMMLYKAVHLRDYEDIRLGQSNLDAVYQTSLKVVEARIAELNQKYDAAEKKFTANNEAVKRGNKFEKLVDWEIRRRNYQSREHSSFSVNIKGKDFDQKQTEECEFWSAVFEMAPFEEMAVLAVTASGNQISFSLTKEDLTPFTGEGAIAESLESVSKEELDAEKRRIVATRQHYRMARMADLMADVNAEVPDVHSRDLEDADLQNSGKKRLFSNWAEEVLGSPLAAMLIRHGYIDENFILYTSVYHETSLSANAMTFKIRHVEREEMNATYELSVDDVRGLLADVGSKELSRPGTYNIHILDYLLRSNNDDDQELLGFVVEGLFRNGDDERGLLQDYFSMDARGESFSKDRKMSLVRVLAPRYAAMFTVLIGLQGVDNDEQRDYVDTALQSASDDIDYDVSTLKDFVESSYEEMNTFGDPVGGMNQKAIVKLVKHSGIKPADLSKVEEKLCGLLIQNNCYEINLSNLNVAAGSGGISLDALASEQPDVYFYVLGALEEYLTAIGGALDKVSAIAGEPSTGKVITDIAASDLNTHGEEPRPQAAATTDEMQLPSLKKILDASNGEWMVDLDSVPRETWPLLAQYGRFIVSVTNLLSYIKEHGMDDSLTRMLVKQNSIVAQVQPSEEDYIELARSLLSVGKLSVKKRISLVASIDSQRIIPAAAIAPEKGELIGSLIKAGLIADDEASYELAKGLNDWPTKEWVIASSKRYPKPTDFVDDDVLRVVNSKAIDEEIKRYIMHHLDLYCANLDRHQIGSAIDYAIEHEEFIIRAEALQWLLGQGVDPFQVVALMARGLDDMKDQDVIAIVRKLRDPYDQLLMPGGKLIWISDQTGHRELLEALKARQIGYVSTFSWEKQKHKYKVNRKRR